MVFSSVPSYLDPPNLQQPTNHQRRPGVENHHNSQLLSPPAPPSGGGSGGGIRPGSMTERARLAKIPHPESALECPRCESTNTKFCYFNNYNLSQPRHFCKSCRRYWTRGGALRNVPVGGGCRRNKRSKGSNNNRSKYPLKSVVSDQVRTGSSSSSAAIATTLASNTCTDMLGRMNLLPPLHHLGDYNSGDIGPTFGGIQAQLTAATARGTSSSNGGSMLTDGFVEQWRLQQVQQFPFLTSLEHPQTGLYSFESETMEVPPPFYGGHQQLRSKPPSESTSVTEFAAAVKMEETPRLNLSRNFLGISGNDNFWGGSGSNPWTDLPGFTSSSTSHLF